MDLAQAVWNADKKTKVIEQLILQIGSPSLTPFFHICQGTRTWSENTQCLLNGVQRAPREVTSEDRAIRAVGASCILTSTWAEEKGCFESSLRGTRLQSLDYYTQSCSQMWDAESSSRCFRQVFGVR
ncbi:MAG TPA: hypothetical protein VNJ08_14520 [Bacteriovoracaceae bacterium]|nr:hypothetical protein [Bacteriovoracaceae bacterium]